MMTNSINENILSSTLYIVPTPIGNLSDITCRALFILRKVNLIAAEDTRRTIILLRYFSISTPLFSFHEYNERQRTSLLLSKLKSGNTIALVSNAGTPLISDPGYYLVRSCWSFGIRVIPLPGACAAITALSASGLPADRFCFEGFLPVRRQARINYFYTVLREKRTLIFYDSKYRIVNTLKDMVNVLGSERRVVLARELTKVWESIYNASLQELLRWLQDNKEYVRGEMILILEGYRERKEDLPLEVKHIIDVLSRELSFKKVINLVVNIYGINKNIVYNYLLKKNF